MFEVEARSTARDNVRLLVIFAVLVALIAVPAWLWKRHEANRPVLAEVRVVSATASDLVFREGPRTINADERVQLAIALRLTSRDGTSQWISAAENMVLDGVTTDHVITSRWPENDRVARVFWFTLEAPVVGGRLGPDDFEAKTTYRTYLAQELGNHWLVEGDPEHHAVDLVNLGKSIVTVNAGTYRPYVRVEVKGTSKKQDRQAATSLGPSDLGNPRMVRISRRLPHEIGLNPVAGELFRLPGFEPENGFEGSVQELSRRRLATSSWGLASATTLGDDPADPDQLTELWRGRWTDDGFRGPDSPRWDSDIHPGDLLRQGEHWLVAVSDDGNGILSAEDLVLHSWGRPPALMPFASALAEAPDTIVLLRRQ